MDSEGQNPNSAVFRSQDIGSKATPEYFSNIQGGKKDKEKVRSRLTKKTRKILVITLCSLAAILFIVALVVVILNATGKQRGELTGEEIPTSISEVENRVYKIVYREQNGGYEEALNYLNDLLTDMYNSDINENLFFAARVFRAELAFEAADSAAGRQLGINEALSLKQEAETERQKYIVYVALSGMYRRNGNQEEGDFYDTLSDELDVETNNGGQGTSDEEGE